ncbi:hypothetical protein BH24ACT26_BH24ACT26_17420 [soil metagenome]
MEGRVPPEDQFTRWRTEYESDIMVFVSSLAGERMFFDGDNSSGVSGDLEGATQIATMMEGYWGMGSTVASHGVTDKVGLGGGGKHGRDDKDADLIKGDLGERIETKLGEILGRAEKLVKDNRLEVLAVAHALEANKTVTGDDVEAIIEGRQGPLIDGRPYHSAEFARLAEDYHGRVMTAPKSHSHVGVALPVLNGHRFEPVGASVEPETRAD